VYPTTKLLPGVARVSVYNEGHREINYGICIADSRPDSTKPVIHCIVLSNDKNGVYPTTNLLKGLALVSIKRKEFEKLNIEIVSQLHATNALSSVLYQ
jgi:hypothetical protein